MATHTNTKKLPFCVRTLLLATACTATFVFGANPAMAENPNITSTLWGSVTVNADTTHLYDISTGSNTGVTLDPLNMGSRDVWNIHQTDTNSLFVGIVEGETFEPSRINGTLNANGRVILRDRNGFIFGNDSVVNVGGIIATSGDVDTAAIQNGEGSFDIGFTGGEGTITNRGTITAAEGGLAALVAPRARNYGVINARLGRVALAAGETVTVDLYGDNLITLAADPATTEAVVENRGTINAEGGTIQLTANAASEIVNNLVNVAGVVNASSATMKGGKIILSGGRVNVASEVNASGTEGGTIEITSRNDTYIRDTANIQTTEGGSITVNAGDDITLYGSTVISPALFFASTLPSAAVESHGGDITFNAAGQITLPESRYVDAGGGNITFTNADGLNAGYRTIRTTGTGNITYEQNKPFTANPSITIASALDAAYNTGTGTTTLRVGEGIWNEFVYTYGDNFSNLVLLGAKAGVDARGAGAFSDGETVVSGAEFYNMDSVKMDGFYVGKPNSETVSELSAPIFTYGISFYNIGTAEASNNIIRGSEEDGIYADMVDVLTVTKNQIDAVGNLKGSHAGVHTATVGTATIANNEILNTGEGYAGIYIDGPSFRRVKSLAAETEVATPAAIPNVIISGNALTNNETGMYFVQGNIDLTGTTNTITGGNTGMVFSPYVASSSPDYETAMFAPMAESPVVTGTTYELNLVGNTIGTTVFDSQSLAFITLENGALFNPGTPTIIDGTQATYTTPFGIVTPALSGGLTNDQFTFIENSIFHYIDDATLGLFNFGAVASGDAFGIEDTYRKILSAYAERNPGPGFTLTGLPRIPGFNTGTRGLGLPENLNDITPAAGGDSAGDLNNIAPAAGGGSPSSCWQDAVNGAAAGNTTTYNMSTSPEDALNQTAACGTAI